MIFNTAAHPFWLDAVVDGKFPPLTEAETVTIPAFVIDNLPIVLFVVELLRIGTLINWVDAGIRKVGSAIEDEITPEVAINPDAISKQSITCPLSLQYRYPTFIEEFHPTILIVNEVSSWEFQIKVDTSEGNVPRVLEIIPLPSLTVLEPVIMAVELREKFALGVKSNVVVVCPEIIKFPVSSVIGLDVILGVLNVLFVKVCPSVVPTKFPVGMTLNVTGLIPLPIMALLVGTLFTSNPPSSTGIKHVIMFIVKELVNTPSIVTVTVVESPGFPIAVMIAYLSFGGELIDTTPDGEDDHAIVVGISPHGSEMIASTQIFLQLSKL